MSRHTQQPKAGIKLPFALQKELGIEGTNGFHGGRHMTSRSVRGRKEQRKAARQEKRASARGSRLSQREEIEDVDEEGEDEDLEDDDVSAPVPVKKTTIKAPPKPKPQVPLPKSILKPSEHNSSPSSDPSSPSSSRSSSPGLVLDASSKAFKDRAAQDDAEISALEKRLGLKKRKRSVQDDGLDDLLGGFEDDSEGEQGGTTERSEARQWLDRKRRKATRHDDEQEEEDEKSGDEDEAVGFDSEEDLIAEGFDDLDDDEDLSENGIYSLEDDHEEDAFEGFDTEQEAQSVKRVRENPYVAPVISDAPVTKYIPPSLRKLQGSEGQSTERLKRQIQGHLNKLSEANIISILGEIEKIYQSNPRQDVTTVLIDLLLTLFCNRSSLQNTFVILHAAFAAAVYKVVGVDFGADLLSQLVDRFDQHHDSDSMGKESLNLISLLSNLFTFHVVSSTIVFDHIRILLSKLSETNTELLLRLIRDCGPQLRQDDPSSLKAIVQLMQKETARMTAAGETMSVRTKFMIETITDLKNNKMKAATSNAGVSSEHITQMRKALGSLNNRPSLRANEPLRISRDDIRNSDRKGKWWLVGASWKGKEPISSSTADNDNDEQITTSLSSNTNNNPRALDPEDRDQVDLAALARAYGMNTSIRRTIFITLLSSLDALDAHTRLLKLRLKRSQEHEIPHVLLRCAAGEVPYNPYYLFVAKRLCGSGQRRMKKAFQYALWGWWRGRLGEKMDEDEGLDDLDEDEGEGGRKVEMTEIANLARLYALLILDNSQTLGVLRVLDLAYVKEKTGMFVELLLVLIFTEAEAQAKTAAKLPGSSKDGNAELSIATVFERGATEAPQIVKRLQFFIKKTVKGSGLVEKWDREAVKKGCKVALKTLRRFDGAGAGGEEME